MNVITYRGAPINKQTGKIEAAGNVSVAGTIYNAVRQGIIENWFSFAVPSLEKIKPGDQDESVFQLVTSSQTQASPLASFSVEIALRHYRYSNGVLCPLLHGAHDRVQFGDQEGAPGSGDQDWMSFRRLQQQTLPYIRQYGKGRSVSVHDYQLCQMPRLLGMLEILSSYIHHLPFTRKVPEQYLPNMIEFAQGVLPATKIVFHRRRYVREFGQFVKDHVPGYRLSDDGNIVISERGRVTQLVVSPIGTDVSMWNKLAQNLAALPRVVAEALEAGKRILVAVARMDYNKAIPELFESWGMFCERFPQVAKTCFLYVIATPSREVVKYYVEARHTIEAAYEQVAAKCPGTVALRKTALPPERLAVLFQNTSVLLAATRVDGWGLTPAEYAATQGAGQIVMTPDTGAFSRFENHVVKAELGDDPTPMAQAINLALERAGSIEAETDMAAIRGLTPTVNGWLMDCEVTPPPTHGTPRLSRYRLPAECKEG